MKTMICNLFLLACILFLGNGCVGGHTGSSVSTTHFHFMGLNGWSQTVIQNYADTTYVPGLNTTYQDHFDANGNRVQEALINGQWVPAYGVGWSGNSGGPSYYKLGRQ
jgi:hypothetical protein